VSVPKAKSASIRYTGANAKAWTTAKELAAKICKPGAIAGSNAQYYHDQRISAGRFRSRFRLPLVEIKRTKRLTFYRASESRVK
jgi:hypothetical protein